MNRLISIIAATALFVGPSHALVPVVKNETLVKTVEEIHELTPPPMENPDQRRLDGYDLLEQYTCQGGALTMTIGAYLAELVKTMLEWGDINDSCVTMQARLQPVLELCFEDNPTEDAYTVYAGYLFHGAFLYKYTSVRGVFVDSTGRIGCFETTCHAGGALLDGGVGALGGILLGDAKNDLPGRTYGGEAGGKLMWGVDVAVGTTTAWKPFAEVGGGWGLGGGIGLGFCETQTWEAGTSEEQEIAEKFKLALSWNEGVASDCKFVDCTYESGLQGCREKCDSNGRCNLFNFCPSTCTFCQACTTPNRCCMRECEQPKSNSLASYKLTSQWSGWDIYVPKIPCYNDNTWRSSTGKSCGDYYDQLLCEDGGYGRGWSASFGLFADYANADGVDASHACCGCRPECHDDDGWRSSTGKSCADYVELRLCENGTYGPGWDPSWGTFATFANNGRDASQACCACNWFTATPTGRRLQVANGAATQLP